VAYYRGRKLQLKLAADGSYDPQNVAQNGAATDEYLGRVNLMSGSSVELKYSFVDAETQEEVSLPRVNLTFYALNVATQQVISASGYKKTYASEGIFKKACRADVKALVDFAEGWFDPKQAVAPKKKKPKPEEKHLDLSRFPSDGHFEEPSKAAKSNEPSNLKQADVEGGEKPPVEEEKKGEESAGWTMDRDGDGDVDMDASWQNALGAGVSCLRSEDLMALAEADVDGEVNERDLPDLSSSSVQWQCHKLLSRLVCVCVAGVNRSQDFFLTQGLESFADGWTATAVHRDLRWQGWRWPLDLIVEEAHISARLTYQWTHGHFTHIAMNTLVTVFAGIPLEGLHGWKRTAFIFEVGSWVFAGQRGVKKASVICGALWHMTFRPHDSSLVGMSAGCYALMAEIQAFSTSYAVQPENQNIEHRTEEGNPEAAMHMADVVMNWSQHKIVLDVGAGMLAKPDDVTGHAAHFGGYLSGLIFGVWFVRNKKVTKCEQVLKVVMLLIGLGCLGFCFYRISLWAPSSLWDDGVPWCWARQAYSYTYFGDQEWHCLRCPDDECAAGFELVLSASLSPDSWQQQLGLLLGCGGQSACVDVNDEDDHFQEDSGTGPLGSEECKLTFYYTQASEIRVTLSAPGVRGFGHLFYFSGSFCNSMAIPSAKCYDDVCPEGYTIKPGALGMSCVTEVCDTSECCDLKPNSVVYPLVQSCHGLEQTWRKCPNLPDCHECYPIDCVFHPWTEWVSVGGCSGLCERTRYPGHNNECGNPCSGHTKETVVRLDDPLCYPPSCIERDRDCVWGAWEEWSSCKHLDECSVCQLSQRYRSRQILVDATGLGSPCIGAWNETRPCQASHAIDCELSEWAEWTSCSKSCGTGWQARMRRVIQEAMFGGRPCAPEYLDNHGLVVRQTQPCNQESCDSPVPCVLSDWSSWEGCSHLSPYQKFRFRDVLQTEMNGGKVCDVDLNQTAGCPEPPWDLPKPSCEMSTWSEWTDCSATCGGQKHRSRRQGAEDAARVSRSLRRPSWVSSWGDLGSTLKGWVRSFLLASPNVGAGLRWVY
ncbi:SPON1, partial [Symbiodinium microadriaticum]